jgi:hypothetical protein
LQQLRDYTCPTGLVGRSNASPRIAVKVFVKIDVVAKLAIAL